MTLLKEKIFDIAVSQSSEKIVKDALKEIEERSLPDRKTEDWRYAIWRKLLKNNYQ